MAIIHDGREERWRIKEGDERQNEDEDEAGSERGCKRAAAPAAAGYRAEQSRRGAKERKKKILQTLPRFARFPRRRRRRRERRRERAERETRRGESRMQADSALFLLIQPIASLSRTRGDTGRRHTHTHTHTHSQGRGCSGAGGNGSGKRGQRSSLREHRTGLKGDTQGDETQAAAVVVVMVVGRQAVVAHRRRRRQRRRGCGRSSRSVLLLLCCDELFSPPLFPLCSSALASSPSCLRHWERLENGIVSSFSANAAALLCSLAVPALVSCLRAESISSPQLPLNIFSSRSLPCLAQSAIGRFHP